MSTENFIPVTLLCTHYQVEMSFISSLHEIGLIEIHRIEKSDCVPLDNIQEIEKMIRMHHELAVNTEGIDVVFNLLQKIEDLQSELLTVKTRLRLYEG